MKILVADDQAYNREILSFILEDYGHDHVHACNGREACELFESVDDIDLVLMDVNMPELDGYLATKEIKKACTDRFVPVIFVTSLDDEDTLDKCLAVGGDDFIPKPLNEVILIAKLKAHERTMKLYNELRSSHQSLMYHRNIMDREHAIIDHVFQNSVKQMESNCENIRFHLSPMSMFNGDLLLVSPSPSGGVYILIGDFTGHGLSAAIGCLPVSDIFYAMTAKHCGVGDIAAEINQRLQDLLPCNMFFCAAIMSLNQPGNRISIWAGGMNDMLAVDQNGKIIETISSLHMPLGILSQEEFDKKIVVFNPPPDTQLYAYTDGVVETRNKEGEMFGEQRLANVIETTNTDRIEAIFAAIQYFGEGNEQDDDVSVVEVTCCPITHIAEPSVPVDPLCKESACGALKWDIETTLSTEQLRNIDAVEQIMNLMSGIQGIARHRDLLFTLIAELYNNSLEHGILGLDSKTKSSADGFELYYRQRTERLEQLQSGGIQFFLKLIAGNPPKLKICFIDTGQGFDVGQVLKQCDQNNDLAFCRGIMLVRSLCESLEYADNGRTVTAIYVLD